MGLRTRALSLVLAFGMMLSILPPPGAFAADNASSTPIEMSDVMLLGHKGDNATYGYPIGSGMDHKTNASGTGWHYDGSTETLYLEAGYTFVNHSTLNYYTSCKVVNNAAVDGWNLWYGDVVNNGTITNSRIHPKLTTNNATGVISTCRIGERASDYAVENNGKIDHCDFIGDGTVAGDHFHESSTANTVTLTGNGTIGHCVFKSKTDYPASNIITNSAFLNNKQNFDGMHTIKMADGETNTKLFAILYDCNSGYGVSGLDTIGFVGSPSLYIAGTTSYGSSRTLASVNGKAIGADDIPGVTTAQTKDPPASVLYATSNGFALTPDGTSDITLSQVVAPAPNPSPDGKLYLDENGVPVYTSGDGWSYEPRTLYDYQGARLTAISVEEFFQNLSITGSVSIMNDTDGKYYFTMPDSAVTIQTSSSTDPSEPSEPSGPSEPAGPGGESDGAGVAGAVVAVTAIGAVSYAVVTRVWLESILPEGSSIPTSRQQLADLLWIAAGRPEPVSKVLYPDISAAEVDHQKAALWYVEQGLLKDNGEVFRPNDHTFRPQVIKAWNQLHDALNAAQ